jgi:hypothetical protein
MATSSTSSSSKSINLNRLSWKTVLDYNQLNAFSVSTDKLDNTTSTKYDDVTTKSYKTSLGLLSKVSSELGKIKTNLQMMLNYSVDGSKAVTDKTKETTYAQLRSLSAGIDSIVRSYKLDKDTLLTGRDFMLSYGSGDPLKMTLDNLASSYNPKAAKTSSSSSSSASTSSSSTDQGLKLATADSGYTDVVSYDYLNTLRNRKVGLSGLDITKAYAIKGDPTHQQVTDGNYQIQVKYNGPTSTVSIEKLDGTVIDKQECDLSGSGQTELKFGCGVGLSIEKTSWALDSGDVDKYDYKTFGSVSLYANLTIDKVQQHNLADGTNKKAIAESSVTVDSGTLLKGTTGMIAVSASTGSVADGRTAMTTGRYSVQVRYDGTKSSLWLYNSDGTLMSTVGNVDLTKDTPTTVDMGTGVSISVNPSQDFTSSKRTYISTLDYTASQNAYQVFDFNSYYDVVKNALKTVAENIQTVSDAQDELKSRYSVIQSATKLANSGTGVTSTSSLLGILSGGSSGISASSLFSTLHSSSSSSTTTPNVLTASTSNIVSALTKSVTSLSGVDNSILALYYKHR